MSAMIPASRWATLSLQAIKRAEEKGIRCQKARDFRGRHVRIWSAEHGCYWRPEAAGYTQDKLEAGLYIFEDAVRRTHHCGPEKKIFYERLTHAEVKSIIEQRGSI